MDPVRPGSISTNRSSPGSSSDLLTPSRPEDSAPRLPADLPPFHYSSLMTHHALNNTGDDDNDDDGDDDDGDYDDYGSWVDDCIRCLLQGVRYSKV